MTRVRSLTDRRPGFLDSAPTFDVRQRPVPGDQSEVICAMALPFAPTVGFLQNPRWPVIIYRDESFRPC